MPRKTGDLRLVPNADAPEPKTGPRLRALREAIGEITDGGMSQQTLARRTHDAAAALGPGYSAIDRTIIVKIETGAPGGGLKHYAHRAVIAWVFGLTTDDLSAYLDGPLSLDEVMQRRHRRPTGRAVIRYADRPDWPALVAAANVVAAEEGMTLDNATFAELGESPTYADSPLDARLVAELAAVVMKHRARRKRGQGTP
jgi:hypothetical protein